MRTFVKFTVYKMIWWNNWIWQETPHDHDWVLILLTRYILKGMFTVLCLWVLGMVTWGQQILCVLFGTKTFGTKTLLLTFLPQFLLHFPFANYGPAGNFQCEWLSLSFKLRSWPPQKLIPYLVSLWRTSVLVAEVIHPAYPPVPGRPVGTFT